MDKTPRFNLVTTPLSGTNLIEAGAGTGKTYAITGLFLRLLVEKRLPVDSILVVTFTEAATQELKTRIRDKIRAALGVFSGKPTNDPFLKSLRSETKDPQIAGDALKQALLAFDQAAIYTIHGFCWKILRENAFESGHLFDTELIEDQEALKKEIVEDFWRLHFYEASPLFVRYALNTRVSLTSLLELMNQGLAHMDLRVVPRPDIPDTSMEETAYRKAHEAAARQWPAVKSEVERLLKYEGLNRRKYPLQKIPEWILNMDHYLTAGPGMILFEQWDKFTPEALAGATKKDCTPPSHPFFDQCRELRDRYEELVRAYEQQLLALKGRLFDYVRAELERRKQVENVLSFDDLLIKVDQALQDPGGGRLKRAIREKFRAALIDEFQDTDPVQYHIFHTLFASKTHILFLVVDPKQAIYGFRGADVFAYMNAARAVGARYTLEENWRSEPGLIRAVNRIFSLQERPFLYEAIPFTPARPADRPCERLTLAGDPDAPFRLWFVDAAQVRESSGPISKTRVRGGIVDAVAGEMARLVRAGQEGKALIGDRPVRERDMAVLVRRNKDAVLMQQALWAFHIRSVIHTTGNLFDSWEAAEMERLLSGLADPNNEALIRTALGTDMMGLSGESLDRVKEAVWEGWLVKFREYREIWETYGFMRMVRRLMVEEGVLPRLVAFSDGERRATNLRHLTEVLHHKESEKRLRVHGLLKWLQEQRAPDTPRLEAHQLRLESDEDLVQIVTIHKSKGLEYPIVFCPFPWDASRLRMARDPFVFHDEAHAGRATLDLGSEAFGENRHLAEKELLAENLRLLYVALTRAQHRCYLVWGHFNQAETAAPAFLLHAEGGVSPQDPVHEVAAQVKPKDEAAMKADLGALVYGAGGDTGGREQGEIQLGPMPVPSGEAALPETPATPARLQARVFSVALDRQWRVSSFSSLISGHSESPDTADRDMLLTEEAKPQEGTAALQEDMDPWSISAFPKGTRAGLCLHDILEHLDFTQAHGIHFHTLVSRKLNEYGFESGWTQTLCDMIHKVLAVPLAHEPRDLTLSAIPLTHRLNELEFTYPLKPISPDAFFEIFQHHRVGPLLQTPPRWTKQLQFSPVKGFMKGFMDMVFQFEGRFFLVDWKSNWLGYGCEAYHQAALMERMETHAYILQYHLYALALDQYLSLRLQDYKYETHFGGIFYIFLRGVTPERPELGVYRDRPAAELMEDLREHLMGGTP